MWTISVLSWIATARRFATNPHTFSLHLDIDGFCLLGLCYHMILDIVAWLSLSLKKSENIKMGSYLALTFRPRTPLTPSSCDNQVFQISFLRLQLFIGTLPPDSGADPARLERTATRRRRTNPMETKDEIITALLFSTSHLFKTGGIFESLWGSIQRKRSFY